MIKTISASAFSTHETCPLQYKYNYIYHLEQLPNEAFEIGTLYHKCLEDYYNGIPKEIILDELKKKIIVNKTDTEIKKFGLIRKMFEKYLLYPIEGETIKTEYRFKIQMPNIDIPVTGVIDRITSKGIIDYKTSSYDYEPLELNNNIQIDIYSYIRWKETGTLPEVIFHINNKKKADRDDYVPQVIKIKRTEQDMKNLEEKIFTKVAIIKEGNFEPNPGNHCYWCPFGKKGTDNCQYSL
jgi:hypothetical protein